MHELEMINIIAYSSNPEMEGKPYDGPSFTDVTRDEILPIYSDWEDEVVAIAENMTKASRWAIHALRPLDKYAEDRVVLLGDAAHAMTPHQGNGAGSAIEDSFILAHCIHQCLAKGLPIGRATDVYNSTRQPFGNFVLNASRKHGLLYQFNDPEFVDVGEHDSSVGPERLKRFAEKVMSEWEYAWSTFVDDELRRVIALF